MSNKVRYISTKSHTYYFLNDITDIKNFDPNNIKIDKKSNKKIILHFIGYVTVKDWKYIKNNSINLLYLIINKVNGYFEKTFKK